MGRAKTERQYPKASFNFVDAEKVFEGDTLTMLDDREDYGERRFVSIGLFNSVVVVISHTERDDVIRIISMRKATKNEEAHYFDQVGNKLGKSADDEGQEN